MASFLPHDHQHGERVEGDCNSLLCIRFCAKSRRRKLPPPTPGRTKLFQRNGTNVHRAFGANHLRSGARRREDRVFGFRPFNRVDDNKRHTECHFVEWDYFPLCCEHRQTVSMKSLDRNSIISVLWFPHSAAAATAATAALRHLYFVLLRATASECQQQQHHRVFYACSL